jgi:TPR repeat protein
MKPLLLTVTRIALMVSAINLAYANEANVANEAKEQSATPSLPSPASPATPNAPAPVAVAALNIADLEKSALQGDFNAQVALGVKYEHAEGVPKDLSRAHKLYCQAAKYGHTQAQFNLGWIYANGRGVPQDDGIAATLFQRAADRGHPQATQLLGVMRQRDAVKLPTCLIPTALPVASAVPLPPAYELQLQAAAREPGPSQQPIIAPKEIMQMVQRLAPQYAIDSDLALALISVESGFNSSALSPAKAQGLMQLIPETAERFGVKNAFSPDENLKGGLAYLRWLLAFFQGDVSLVLAAYNAGEGAVEKFRGIPPYTETQDYVRKITGLYKKATHPYNPSIAKPSSLVSDLKRLQ